LPTVKEDIALSVDVSVIVPTKNRPGDLADCLSALARAAAAARAEVEVIVVDDGTDHARCRAVVERAAAGAAGVRFAYELNPGPAGAAGARNHGVGCARGRILGFVDDDAVVAETWIGMALARCAPGTALTGRIEGIGDRDAFSQARQARYDSRHRKGLANPLVDYLAGGNSVVWAEDFRAVGGFDVAFEMMHDREVALRLVANGVTIRYDESLAILHRHFKGLGTYVTMTMRSGRFRRKLERRHAGAVGPWRARDVVSSFRSTSATTKAKLVVALSELLHGLGYMRERFLNER
jgi:glycosyltransferase involved in cell wall biosynthesis